MHAECHWQGKANEFCAPRTRAPLPPLPTTRARLHAPHRHLSVTHRQEGQSKAEELAKKDLRAELEEKERKHFLKAKGPSFEGTPGWREGSGEGGGSRAGSARWGRALGFLPVCRPLQCTGRWARSDCAMLHAEERQEDLRLLEDSSHAREGPARTLMPSAADADDEDDSDAASSSDDDDDDEVSRPAGAGDGCWTAGQGSSARPKPGTGVGKPCCGLHRLHFRGLPDLFRGG